jgi:uracil-DNA glycosylase family 4
MLRDHEAVQLSEQIRNGNKKDNLEISSPLRDKIQKYISDIIYGVHGSFTLTYKNCTVPCDILAGRLWFNGGECGPKPAEVMVINKMTYNDDIAAGSTMHGETAQMFYTHLCNLGIDPADWYVTNFIKSRHPEWETQKTNITAGMIAEFKPLLLQEILLVQPKIILCLGVEALNAVIGKKTTISKSKETVYKVPFVFPSLDRIEEPDYFNSQIKLGYKNTERRDVWVIGIPHPHSVLRAGDRGSLDGLNTDIDFFIRQLDSLTENNHVAPREKEEGLDHRIIWSLDEYEALAKEIEETCEDNLISIDVEWNGSHPQNKNSYPRCFQISWKHKTAACIALAPQTEDCDMPAACYYRGEDKKRLIQITRRIIKGRRMTGHFIEADLEWLVPFGLDLRNQFRVPNSWEEYKERWLAGEACGFDTARAAHAVSETCKLGLKEQARLHTEAGRYDRDLDEWIDENTLKSGVKPSAADIAAASDPSTQSKRQSKPKKKRLDGYGIIPDDLLYKYGCYDADVTRRLTLYYTEKLSSDEFGNDCWKPFWIAMRALLPILEIDSTGLLVNTERMEEMTQQYMALSEQLLQEIRDWARWPDFNPRSSYQMRELLFGSKYNRKPLSKEELRRLPDGMAAPEYVRIRPPQAKTLGLEPLFTTDKYAKPWSRVVSEGRDHLSTPSTDNDTLTQLTAFHSRKTITLPNGERRTLNFKPILEKLWKRNVVSQTLKYVLKPPRTDETFEPVYDNDGNLLYDKGIPSCICDDGRVRTSIMFGKATGRWSSISPSLQNLGNTADERLHEILGDEYRYPLKSIFRAAPGHVFISADYIGAEVACSAFMCNDEAMIEHVRRNQLPETDPLFYDIHSHIAVSAFHLDCVPTKEGLKSIGKKYLRTIAKEILFGIFYGRSPRSIAEKAKSEGIFITEEEAYQIIEHIKNEYPLLIPYFESCASRAEEPRWLANAFGRYRRFPKAIDYEQLRRFERQAKNFPIQGCVADIVNRAVDYFCHYRDKWGLKTKLVLQIHDDIMAETPDDEVKIVYEKLFPTAMVKSVPIIGTLMNGRPLPNSEEHRLGIDFKISREWGVPIHDLSEWDLKS